MPEAPTKYWRQLLGPALVSPHSYCVTRMSHERCVDVLPSAKVALWHTELASITTETERNCSPVSTGVHFMVRSRFRECEEENLRSPACCS